MASFLSSRFTRMVPWALALAALGCGTTGLLSTDTSQPQATETASRIEAGDVVWLDVFDAMPETEHRLQTGDMLHVHVPQALPAQPINGSYLVDPAGMLSFGSTYGSISVAGQTGQEAAVAIENHLRGTLTDPQVAAKVVFTARQEDAAMTLLQEEYSGEHTVADDGTITLGNYGQVALAGLTLDEAARAIQQHATQVRLDVEIRTQHGTSCSVVFENLPGGSETHQVVLAPGDTVRTVLERVVELETLRGKILWITPPNRIRPGLARLENIAVHDLSAESRGIHQHIFAGDTIHVGEPVTMRQIRTTSGDRRITHSSLFDPSPSGESTQSLQRFPRENQNNQF